MASGAAAAAASTPPSTTEDDFGFGGTFDLLISFDVDAAVEAARRTDSPPFPLAGQPPPSPAEADPFGFDDAIMFSLDVDAAVQAAQLPNQRVLPPRRPFAQARARGLPKRPKSVPVPVLAEVELAMLAEAEVRA